MNNPDAPDQDIVDLGDGRTVQVSLADARIGRVSIAVIALLIACMFVGFILTVAFLLPDFFQDRTIRPFQAAAAGLFAALSVYACVAYVRRTQRTARAALEQLTSRTPPVPAREAAVSALLAARTVQGVGGFDTALYLRGAGDDAPRLVFVGLQPPPIPPPESPGEVVPVPMLRRGVWSASAVFIGITLFNVAFQVPGLIGSSTRDDASRWLSWSGIIVMLAVLPVAAIGYLKLKQPRYIVPGALCNDSRGEQVFVTSELSVLTVRHTRFLSRLFKVTIHNRKAMDITLYFASEARLVDFLSRWLLPLAATVTPASAPTPPPAPAERSPEDRAADPAPTPTGSTPGTAAG